MKHGTPTLLIVGLGDLGRRVALQAALLKDWDIVLGARDLDRAAEFANLVRFAVLNATGRAASISGVRTDLLNVEQVATAIESVRPDVLLCTASLQSWRRITELPKPVFNELDQAQFGPWLPMHLAPCWNLMLAVDAAQCERPVVVNAAFPDAVGPVLGLVGQAPDIGIGNVANLVPALRVAASRLVGSVDVVDVEVRLVAHHYFSHFVPRFGHAMGIPHRLEVRIHGNRVPVDEEPLFSSLQGDLKRAGGVEGQTLTAGSAMHVLTKLMDDDGHLFHAPSPGGEPGGYPCRIDNGVIDVALPDEIEMPEARRINEEGQTLDGISEILAGGEVVFASSNMAVMEDLLGYHCSRLKLEDSWQWASELAAKYAEFQAKHSG